MNVQYLKRAIRDQVDRAQSLEDEIPPSPKHAALERLATLCKSMLEKQARILKDTATRLDDQGDEASIGNALMIIKQKSREFGMIEGFGMPPLHCQSKQVVFLNSVLSKMHSEMRLPFPCPAVSCTSNDYYFSHQFTNTIHVPLSEAAFLLHMPDFYHELGHLLLTHPSHEVESQLALEGAAGAVEVINHWYLRQMDRVGPKSTAASAQGGMKWMWKQWGLKWAQEAFCDLFALFAAGPAYAYSNLHLVLKMDVDMYGIYLFSDQEHPAGEARMRLLDAGMRLLGHGREASHIKKEWDAMARFCGDPRPEYNDAFPSPLLQEIAETVLAALGRSGLRGYSGAKMSQGVRGTPTVAVLLNDAWRGFWDDRDGEFRSREKELVSKLAAMSRSGAT